MGGRDHTSRHALLITHSGRARRTESATVANAARSGRRAWRAVPLIVLAVILVVLGYYAIRVRQTFHTLNAVSTPAASLSGDALGGPADLQIDTGPAQTALAGSDEQSMLVPAASAGGSSGGAAPIAPAGGSARVTLPDPPAAAITSNTESAATPAAEASPEPPRIILSELERVKNGGFEQGDKHWYLEDEATISTEQARTGKRALALGLHAVYADQELFFIAGTEYQASAWGKLYERGSYVNFGVVYWDAEGNRLPDLEPAPMQFTDTRWKKLTFTFTPPQEVATVKIFFWKPDNATRAWLDDVSARSVVPETTLAGEGRVSEAPAGVMTILLMGVDARPGEAIDIGVRPDSLAVVELNAETGSCRLLAIPRDTRTELPGYGKTKVNHALAVGGIDYQMQVVEGLLGLQLDHYVLIDFNGFEELVDAVGGVTVDVPADFTSSDGTLFAAGRQEMNGRQALSYARWRGGADGDFGRIERQQQLLRALVRKASGLNIARSVNELLPAVEANLRTDFSPTDIVSIGRAFQARCTDETVSMLSLEGSAATYDDPLLQMPLYYIEVDEAEIRGKVAALLEP